MHGEGTDANGSAKFNENGLNALVGALYGDLHRIAACHLKNERPDHTLQATALLHEAYLKLSDDRARQFSNRTHFLSTASRVMRQVLVDYARARNAEKRGGGHRDEVDVSSLPPVSVMVNSKLGPIEVLSLNQALEALAQEDASLEKLIEMRYFGGMTAEETAEALGQSVHAVRHDLRLAHAWLRRELTSRPSGTIGTAS